MVRILAIILLFLYSILASPITIAPSYAISIGTNPKCTFSGDNRTCKIVVVGDSSDDGKQVTVQLRDHSGNVLQSGDCTIKKDLGIYMCDVSITAKSDTWANSDIAVIDKKTGEELFNSKKLQGYNPCERSGSCKTAIGNISTDPQAFASKILGIATGLAGGRDMIVAAVAGLLFLIFSVLILRFIGITILGL